MDDLMFCAVIKPMPRVAAKPEPTKKGAKPKREPCRDCRRLRGDVIMLERENRRLQLKLEETGGNLCRMMQSRAEVSIQLRAANEELARLRIDYRILASYSESDLNTLVSTVATLSGQRDHDVARNAGVPVVLGHEVPGVDVGEREVPAQRLDDVGGVEVDLQGVGPVVPA